MTDTYKHWVTKKINKNISNVNQNVSKNVISIVTYLLHNSILDMENCKKYKQLKDFIL